MATETLTSFNNMLKKYMPYKLLWEEVMKRDYFLTKVAKDNNWKGGEMQIPFKAGSASSFKYGGLTAQGAITQNAQVLGTLSGYKELWGSMIFNDHDLHQHGNMEQSFLKVLPDMLTEFVDNMKQIVSVNLLNGPHLATVLVDGVDIAGGGTVGIDRPGRFTLGQYVEFGNVGSLTTQGWIKKIDVSAKELTIVNNIDLTIGTPVDLSGVLAAQAGPIAAQQVFIAGAILSGKAFTSLKDQTLSLVNGGSADLFGKTKLDYPHLQSLNYNGAGHSAKTVLELIFDGYNATREEGKGHPTDVIMGYGNLAAAMKELEGSRDYVTKDTKANRYGWTEIDVVGVKGKLKLVGVLEMDNDIMHITDWNTIKLHSNGYFERRTSPEGDQYFPLRTTEGYQYIVDTRFFGELVVSKPSSNGIIYAVPEWT